MDSGKGSGNDGFCAQVSGGHGRMFPAGPFTVILIAHNDKSAAVFLIDTGKIREPHPFFSGEKVCAVTGFTGKGI